MSDTAKKGVKGIVLTLMVSLISMLGGASGSYFLYKGEIEKGRAAVESAAKSTAATLEEKYLDAFTKELDAVRSENKAKATELKDLYEANRGLRAENNDLRDAIRRYENTSVPGDAKQLLELVFNAMPYPAWLHEPAKTNWFINDAYAKQFAVNRANFWTPINVLRQYPSDVSARYVANDMHVIESRVGQMFREKVNAMVLYPEGPDNPAKEWDVLKIPMVVEGKSYVFGACVDGTVPESIFIPFLDG